MAVNEQYNGLSNIVPTLNQVHPPPNRNTMTTNRQSNGFSCNVPTMSREYLLNKALQYYNANQHQKNCSPQRPFNCFECQMSFYSMYELTDHVKYEHLLRCLICYTKVKNQQELLNHYSSDCSSSCINCPQCNTNLMTEHLQVCQGVRKEKRGIDRSTNTSPQPGKRGYKRKKEKEIKDNNKKKKNSKAKATVQQNDSPIYIFDQNSQNSMTPLDSNFSQQSATNSTIAVHELNKSKKKQKPISYLLNSIVQNNGQCSETRGKTHNPPNIPSSTSLSDIYSTFHSIFYKNLNTGKIKPTRTDGQTKKTASHSDTLGKISDVHCENNFLDLRSNNTLHETSSELHISDREAMERSLIRYKVNTCLNDTPNNDLSPTAMKFSNDVYAVMEKIRNPKPVLANVINPKPVVVNLTNPKAVVSNLGNPKPIDVNLSNPRANTMHTLTSAKLVPANHKSKEIEALSNNRGTNLVFPLSGNTSVRKHLPDVPACARPESLAFEDNGITDRDKLAGSKLNPNQVTSEVSPPCKIKTESVSPVITSEYNRFVCPIDGLLSSQSASEEMLSTIVKKESSQHSPYQISQNMIHQEPIQPKSTLQIVNSLPKANQEAMQSQTNRIEDQFEYELTIDDCEFSNHSLNNALQCVKPLNETIVTESTFETSVNSNSAVFEYLVDDKEYSGSSNDSIKRYTDPHDLRENILYDSSNDSVIPSSFHTSWTPPVSAPVKEIAQATTKVSKEIKRPKMKPIRIYSSCKDRD